MSKVLKTLSLFDVEDVLKQIDKTLKDFPCQEIEDALFSIGFDRRNIEVEHDVLHRPMRSPNNNPWNGSRFVGYERQDRSWLFSGKSTLENDIASQHDNDHRRDLVTMSMQPNFTAAILSHMESKGDVLMRSENKRDVNKGDKY